MQDISRPVSPLPIRDQPGSVLAALARACVLLEAGELGEAARWAAIAARLSEAGALIETA